MQMIADDFLGGKMNKRNLFLSVATVLILTLALLWFLPFQTQLVKQQRAEDLQFAQFEALAKIVTWHMQQSRLGDLNTILTSYVNSCEPGSYAFVESRGNILGSSGVAPDIFDIRPETAPDGKIDSIELRLPAGNTVRHLSKKLGMGAASLHFAYPAGSSNAFLTLDLELLPFYLAATIVIILSLIVFSRQSQQLKPGIEKEKRIRRKVELETQADVKSEWRAVIEDIPAGVFIVNSDKRTIDFANIMAANLIGIPKRGIEGRELSDYLQLTTSGDLPLAEITNTARRNRGFLVTKKDRNLPIAHYKSFVEYDNENKELVVFFDISEMRDLEDRLKQAFSQKEKLANHDQLTGLLNRRAITSHAETELSRAQRGETMSLAILDIDHFKSINDNYGHDVGDVVLKQLAAFVKPKIRPYDWFGRWGGEEFILILPNTGVLEGAQVLDRLRESMAQQQFGDKKDNLKITTSIGIASTEPDSAGSYSIDKIVKLADEALYHAKNSGRNRVALSQNGESLVLE